MDYDELVDALKEFLISNPKFTDQEFMQALKTAKIKAVITDIPSYRPLAVADKRAISTDYEDKQKKATRIHYRDESTEEFE
ncbi:MULTISPECIES: hypothetical protein [Lactobacillaceae]|uniref:hypothetical protein n=1 Tax=Lactobacillaceae TaxID=33958 RepID=UPI0007B5621B|nr:MULTISPECIES: hypothetical protein [Lactobacillaceae]KZU18121.1 hypothetical protein Nizo2484_2335 [Lactiplantibacillus plantarum]KZU18609.1 hypothetical protein Nizo2457_1324 [Lactiplantibacillus plantarum]MCT1175227.1 hypothetical protein [Pediococcus pentosaceus]